MASSRTPLDWFNYQVGMHSFQAFARGKATWILNYSWDGDRKVDAREAMMNLAMSQIMAGTNFWDAPGHSMAGSNDPPTRKKIFSWIKSHQDTFYHPRLPIAPIGVYFSPDTRNYYAEDFIRSYRGILILLMQEHAEFQIVTPRTLAEFEGSTLILPDVRVVSDSEKAQLQRYVAGGEKLVITGDDPAELGSRSNVVRFSKCPGKDYYAALTKDFSAAKPDEEREFLASLQSNSQIQVKASPMMATSIAQVDGKPHVFLANFAGLQAGANPVQTVQKDVEITISGSQGPGFFLPFLGDVKELKPIVAGNVMTYNLPPIEKGGVFWVEP